MNLCRFNLILLADEKKENIARKQCETANKIALCRFVIVCLRCQINKFLLHVENNFLTGKAGESRVTGWLLNFCEADKIYGLITKPPFKVNCLVLRRC